MDIPKRWDSEAETRARRELGERIVRRRTERGMTQVALATKLGIDRSRLGKWERGHHAPLLIQLVALSWVLEMTLDELLTGRTLAAQPGQPLIDRNTLASVVETLTRLLQCKPARGGLL